MARDTSTPARGGKHRAKVPTTQQRIIVKSALRGTETFSVPDDTDVVIEISGSDYRLMILSEDR